MSTQDQKEVTPEIQERLDKMDTLVSSLYEAVGIMHQLIKSNQIQSIRQISECERRITEVEYEVGLY